jgi:hypothetical protein
MGLSATANMSYRIASEEKKEEEIMGLSAAFTNPANFDGTAFPQARDLSANLGYELGLSGGCADVATEVGKGAEE